MERTTRRTGWNMPMVICSRTSTIVATVLLAVYLAWPCYFEADLVIKKPAPYLEGVYHPSYCKASHTGRKQLRLPELSGIESVVFDTKGIMYGGSRHGDIWKVDPRDGGSPSLLTQTGSRDCGDDEEHEECGRPLGLRLLDDTTLLVIDIHIGLLSISTVTGDTEVLVKQGEVVDGLPVVRLNDLDVDLDKKQVYMSQMNRFWSHTDLEYHVLEASCAGRILRYDIDSKLVEEVIDDVCFPNGVQLSVDKKRLLFSETSRFQISVVDLTVPVANRKKQVFDDNTVGFPDNVRPHPKGGYLVAVPSVRDKVRHSEWLLEWPSIRRLLWKLTPKAVYNIIDNSVQYGMCVHYHDNGTILNTYHFAEYDDFRYISQCTVAPDNRTLYASSRLSTGVLATPLE